MDTLSKSTRDLARRLLAASQASSGSRTKEAVVVIEKLRISLTRFAGSEGFSSLLRRALVLARAETPSLESVKIDAQGQLEGFESLVADTGTGATGEEAAVAITGHLLRLLETFIGRPFTLKLVREAWPDTLLDEENSTIERTS